MTDKLTEIINAIERLAFDIPPVNEWTPQIVQHCIALRHTLARQSLSADMEGLVEENRQLRDLLANANNFWRHEFDEAVDIATTALFKRLAAHRTIPRARAQRKEVVQTGTNNKSTHVTQPPQSECETAAAGERCTCDDVLRTPDWTCPVHVAPPSPKRDDPANITASDSMRGVSFVSAAAPKRDEIGELVKNALGWVFTCEYPKQPGVGMAWEVTHANSFITKLATALQQQSEELERVKAQVDRFADGVNYEQRRNREAQAEIKRLRSALEGMVYEATHLSPQEENGDHKCRISAAALRRARSALTGGKE